MVSLMVAQPGGGAQQLRQVGSQLLDEVLADERQALKYVLQNLWLCVCTCRTIRSYGKACQWAA